MGVPLLIFCRERELERSVLPVAVGANGVAGPVECLLRNLARVAGMRNEVADAERGYF